MADVVIAGGGVIGCAAAYYLTKAGASVTLLEKGEVGGAASGAAAGMLVPPAEAAASGPFRTLSRAGLALYPELVAALSAGPPPAASWGWRWSGWRAAPCGRWSRRCRSG